MKKNHEKKSKKFPLIKYLKLSLLYFILFVTLFALIDYYASMNFNLKWFIIASVVAAVVSGYIHIKQGKHTHIDDVVDELL